MPDVGGFIKRAAVFGGIDTILGTVLAPFFGIGAAAGMAGGLGFGSTVAGYQFSKLLTNPKNTKYLFEALDSRIPYFKRYSAGIRLLELTHDSLIEAGVNVKDEFKEDYSNLLKNFDKFYKEAIENIPNEGDKEPLKFQNFGEVGLLENPAARGDMLDEKETVIVSEPDEIEEEIVIDVPRVNQQFNMENVVPPMVDPAQATGSGDINPEIIEQMASLGMPLFGNEGGIASLMKQKKPQQMVA